MSQDKLRQQVAIEAARLIFRRQEHDPYRATLRAARHMFRGWLKPDEFPSPAEIRMHLQQMSWMHEGDVRFDNRSQTLQAAAALMRRLEAWRPRLVGSVVAGATRHHRHLRVIVFSDDPDAVGQAIAFQPFERIDGVHRRGGQARPRTLFRYRDDFETRVVCYPEALANRKLRHVSTGRLIPALSLPRLEKRLSRVDPDGAARASGDECFSPNRFDVYRMLLAPLASVQQRKSSHPEGDALYHSLQVFELARQQSPYDEEFLLAALLHDVGKAIDPLAHVDAALSALKGHVTERTEWLIANHHDAHRLREGTLGARAKRRLRESPDYEELMTLARCDAAGRVPGGTAPDIDTALDYIRGVARMCGDSD
ncbi:HD domain protein [Caulifigura coniformis]|uniref:HD domain protein n=1 Tax=Caulifigura coniformis TaxID=2527983 RepID=A0A517S8Z9_9PLAN|nr:HD domain-containing protein [Caulifigura coniformis]QDT52582.1 HD domain protein [Caulifigura coniformis]